MTTMTQTKFWSLDTVRLHVNAALEQFYEAKVAEAAQLDPEYEFMWRALQRLALAGGKRLRPYVCMLSYQAAGGTNPAQILPVLVSQELLHLSVLIHDDIIDHDDVRYGVPNITGQLKSYYAARHMAGAAFDKSGSEHYADSAAILAGDVLLSAAYGILNNAGLSPEIIQLVQGQLDTALFVVAAGELLDTTAASLPLDMVDPMKIATYKTASYSFVGPLTTGVKIAGIHKQSLGALTEYANNLGIAFQMIDDILGVFGDSQITGKSTTSDVAELKRTYMLCQTYRCGSNTDRKLLDKLLQQQTLLSETDIQLVKQAIERSGALAATRALAASYHDRAVKALQNADLSVEAQQAYQQLADNLLKRVK